MRWSHKLDFWVITRMSEGVPGSEREFVGKTCRFQRRVPDGYFGKHYKGYHGLRGS